MSRIFLTGGTGVLGRAVVPLLAAAGHLVNAPGHADVDLFDLGALAPVLSCMDAILHLATRIPPAPMRDQPHVWDENDRLRADATKHLVDTALDLGVGTFVFSGIAFMYPAEEPANGSGPVIDSPVYRSALVAEEEVARFANAGRRGVVVRLGYLYGPGTDMDEPEDPALYISDAGTALVAALDAPSGIYDVVEDGSRIDNGRFKEATGWRPAGDPS